MSSIHRLHYTLRMDSETAVRIRIYEPDQRQHHKTIIFCYGLSKVFSKDHQNVEYFAQVLSRDFGFSVVTFDYRGAGKNPERTGMLFSETSLTTRAEDTRAVIRFVRSLPEHKDDEITLHGHSAGGAIVARISGESAIRGLLSRVILSAPAAYHPEAWKKNFGENFRNVLRVHRSWVESLEFEGFGSFPGKKTIIACHNDQVVKLEITQEYIHFAPESLFKVIFERPHGHKVFGFRNKTDKLAKLIGFFESSVLKEISGETKRAVA